MLFSVCKVESYSVVCKENSLALYEVFLCLLWVREPSFHCNWCQSIYFQEHTTQITTLNWNEILNPLRKNEWVFMNCLKQKIWNGYWVYFLPQKMIYACSNFKPVRCHLLSFYKPIQTSCGHEQQRQNKHGGHIKTTVNCESVQTEAVKVTTDNANAFANQRARNNVTTAVAH